MMTKNVLVPSTRFWPARWTKGKRYAVLGDFAESSESASCAVSEIFGLVARHEGALEPLAEPRLLVRLLRHFSC